METYNIRIGDPGCNILWTENATSLPDLLDKTNKRIAGLAPLNSSVEGAKAYRARFEKKNLYTNVKGEKTPVLVGMLD